jgi:hypothetical protein
MNTRIFSVLAAIAMSSVAIPAMARDTTDAATTSQPAASTQRGTTQSAQAMPPSARGNAYGSPTASSYSSQWQRTDDTVRGIGNNVKVGNGPGYAWWKDR